MPSRSRTFGVRDAAHDYSGVVVLREVDFMMTSGEVHALLGANGSGKSTLVRVLTGVLSPSLGGKLLLDEQPIHFASPADAQLQGIGVVHQDYHLFPNLTVAENVFGVSKPPPRRRWLPRAIDKVEVDRQVDEMLTALGIEVPAHALVKTLGPAERKFVEIARAMLLEPEFLFLDEPTASLEPRAARSVLHLLDRLRARGVGMCFISHRLDEVLESADRITVLRDGRRIAHQRASDVSEQSLAKLITGAATRATPGSRTPASRGVGEEVMLELSGVQLRADVPPVELAVKRGEILGLTGLLGSGAADVVQRLGGMRPLHGQVTVGGRRGVVKTPRQAMRLGIGFIPEDRKAVGLFADQSVAMNISLPSLTKVSTAGWLRFGALDELANRYRESLAIKTPSVHAPVKTLSGGNQQKVMLAKWLASSVQVLVVEEPTHGVDVGAKAQVHDLLRAFAADGGAIVIASTDVGEVLELCDRIGVMRHGALTDVVETAGLSESEVTVMGTGEVQRDARP